jgi:hypothetical protein
MSKTCRIIENENYVSPQKSYKNIRLGVIWKRLMLKIRSVIENENYMSPHGSFIV